MMKTLVLILVMLFSACVAQRTVTENTEISTERIVYIYIYQSCNYFHWNSWDYVYWNRKHWYTPYWYNPYWHTHWNNWYQPQTPNITYGTRPNIPITDSQRPERRPTPDIQRRRDIQRPNLQRPDAQRVPDVQRPNTHDQKNKNSEIKRER
jgi:hypothetical protein